MYFDYIEGIYKVHEMFVGNQQFLKRSIQGVFYIIHMCGKVKRKNSHVDIKRTSWEIWHWLKLCHAFMKIRYKKATRLTHAWKYWKEHILRHRFDWEERTFTYISERSSKYKSITIVTIVFMHAQIPRGWGLGKYLLGGGSI